MSDYQPIACGAYDQIEVLAMHRVRVTLVHLGEADKLSELLGEVVDTSIRNGAEYLVLSSQGERVPVRLDRIIEIRDAKGHPLWRQRTDV